MCGNSVAGCFAGVVSVVLVDKMTTEKRFEGHELSRGYQGKVLSRQEKSPVQMYQLRSESDIGCLSGM